MELQQRNNRPCSEIFDPTDAVSPTELIITSGEVSPGAGYTYRLANDKNCSVCCEDSQYLLSQESLIQSAPSGFFYKYHYNEGVFRSGVNNTVPVTLDITSSTLALNASTSIIETGVIINVSTEYTSEILISSSVATGDIFINSQNFIGPITRYGDTYKVFLSNRCIYGAPINMGYLLLTEVEDNYTEFYENIYNSYEDLSIVYEHYDFFTDLKTTETRRGPAPDQSLYKEFSIISEMSGRCEGMASVWCSGVFGFSQPYSAFNTQNPSTYVDIKYERCNGYPIV